jgi:hypothetical protein
MCETFPLDGDDQRIEGHFELPQPAPSRPAPGRWLSEADRAWEDADPDEPPAYGRPRAHRLD